MRRVALTGLCIAGLYSACDLLALDHGVTPGTLATVLYSLIARGNLMNATSLFHLVPDVPMAMDWG